jgi:hypothetical protein
MWLFLKKKQQNVPIDRFCNLAHNMGHHVVKIPMNEQLTQSARILVFCFLVGAIAANLFIR